MRFTTDLLYQLIRATRFGDASPDEVTVQVPPLLVPVFQARGALSAGIEGGTNTPRRESFTYDVQNILGPSSAQVIGAVVATFSAGMWFLLVTVNVNSDFNDSVGSSRGSLTLTSPAGLAGIIWIAGRGIANVSKQVTLYVPLLIPEDGWQLTFNHGATGVAQNSDFRVSGLAFRES